MRTQLALVLAVLACDGFAADQTAGLDLFEKEIRPVMVERCYSCHSSGSPKPMAGLLLDSAEGIRRAVERGLLLPAVKRDGRLKMPPAGPLTDDQVAGFEAWINLGAPTPPMNPRAAYNFEEARKFWSFLPVRDPRPPEVSDPAWNKTAIDRFLKKKLDEKKLKPVGAASKHALIRRATYDLTGLPPTPEQVDAFLADTSLNAFDKVIDRLLSSQQYGERWGRHWLDLVRYADTSGCNADFPVPDAYRYRNWVIGAFNDDMSYMQFLREQLAGDLLPGLDRDERIIATGYLAIARRFGSGAGEFHLTIDDTIDNLGKTMLGLSIGCARCHDHKFDPIPSRDYYALYGIFESTKYAFPGTEAYPHAKDFVALGGRRASDRLKAYQDETASIDQRIQDINAGREGKDLSKEDKDKEISRLKDRLKVLAQDVPKVAKAYAVSEGVPGDAQIQRKGDPYNRGERVPRGFLQVLGGQTLPPEETGSGRVELAGWITDPANPLTARVMVNRIWQHHFGKGIVDTPSDFGARGDRPVNPELLDWLASRFQASGYSVKAMHRLIMRTRAYQMAAGDDKGDKAGTAIDPENRYLWRFDRRRLDAEEIRDAMLFVAGDLDPSVGGRHPFPDESTFRYTQHTQFFAVYDTRQRSVYLMQQRLKKHPLLELFDGADPNAGTASRASEETSLQALAMMNNPFVNEQADLLAVRVGMAFTSDSERIRYAYRLVYGRAPSLDEIVECQRYLVKMRAAYQKTDLPVEKQPRAVLAGLVHALLASNEFIFVD